MAVVMPATAQETEESAIDGFTFGVFPKIAFDRYNGLELGGWGAVYDFGNRGNYPNPRQQIFVEASGSTKGSQHYVLSYDNRFLIPGIRFTFSASYSDDKALGFYGFGGYKSCYDAGLPESYYMMSRKSPYGKLDFTGRITGNLYWKFGYHFRYFILDEYSHDELAEMPYGKSLFAWYKALGFIEADECSGGMTSAWRAGLMFDSRDAEGDPSRGIWAEAFMEWAPKWMGTNKAYGRYYAVMRQYVPIVRNKLTFAYRASVQGFIGKPGFYALPCEPVLGPGWDHEGFGGYNTIRGVMRNRIQGQATCCFNTEIRWKFYNTTLLGQNLSFGANLFFDGGRVLKDYTDISVNASTWSWPVAEGLFPEHLTKGGVEKFHLSGGAGLKVILNRNFVISLDYGRAFNRQDNRNGGTLYFNSGFIFRQKQKQLLNEKVFPIRPGRSFAPDAGMHQRVFPAYR